MAMFSRKRGATGAPGTGNSSPPPTSIVAFGMAVKGEVVPYGDKPFRLHVEGRVEGDVEADQVVIGETGKVTGNIHARNVVIKGELSGDVEGEDVRIGPSARVDGNIIYDRIVIEQADITASLRKRQARVTAAGTGKGAASTGGGTTPSGKAPASEATGNVAPFGEGNRKAS